MAIYFYKNLIGEALKTIAESHEFFDISSDLENVRQQMELVRASNLVWENDNCKKFVKLQQARDLNEAIRKKYPVIDNMLDIADRLLPDRPPYAPNGGASETREYSLLEQDYYGILCHVLLKKGIAEEIEECIEKVE